MVTNLASKQQSDVKRNWWAHLNFTRRTLNQHFSSSDLDEIERLVTVSEKAHRAELRIVIEGRLSPLELVRGVTPKQRAIDLFSSLRVWDTEENCGILVYFLLADRAVELIADRGAHRAIGSAAWESLLEKLRESFSSSKFHEGLTEIVASLTKILAEHFPPNSCSGSGSAPKNNELTNRPLLIL